MIAWFLDTPVSVTMSMAEDQRRNRQQVMQGEPVAMQDDDDVDRRAFLRQSVGLGGAAVLGGLAEPDLSRLLYGHAGCDAGRIDLDDLNARVVEAWTLWLNRADRFSVVAALLPQLAKDVERVIRQFSSPQEQSSRRRAYSIATRHYFLLRSFFRAAGRYDLATQAADRGVLAAEHADDPLLIAAGKWSLATVLLIDDRSALGEEMALEAARTIASGTDDRTRAMYGALHLTAASAAVRNHGNLASARNHYVLRAENVMPEDIHYHPVSKPLIRSLLRRSRPSIRQEAEALAQRIGFGGGMLL